jgi:hypothetical protein
MALILLLSHIAGDISYLLQYILSWKKPRHNIIEIANENVIFQYSTEAYSTNAHENTNNIFFIIRMERIA